MRIENDLPADVASTDDDSDIGMRLKYKSMQRRLVELETLYASRFRNQVPTATAELKSEHGIKCGLHPHVSVSMTTPEVRCTACKKLLDPLDVLRQFANRERQFSHTLEHLRNERDKLEKDVEELKRQRSNLRAQVKRAAAKHDGEVAS
jgi:hypothetical protein